MKSTKRQRQWVPSDNHSPKNPKNGFMLKIPNHVQNIK